MDDAIVVIENIYRFIEHGRTADAGGASKGARQIGFTVISMSTSLVAVFIPLLFMGGLIGRLFHEFAVTVEPGHPGLGRHFADADADALLALPASRNPPIGKPGPFYRACERSFNWLLGHYETGLRWVLRHHGFMLGGGLR